LQRIGLTSYRVFFKLDAGQFQLFSGTMMQWDHATPVVLKINTQTGQTWELLSTRVTMKGVSQPITVTAWSPVNENLYTELQKMGAIGESNAPTPKPSGTP
jgi:hypothetical protein